MDIHTGINVACDLRMQLAPNSPTGVPWDRLPIQTVHYPERMPPGVCNFASCANTSNAIVTGESAYWVTITRRSDTGRVAIPPLLALVRLRFTGWSAVQCSLPPQFIFVSICMFITVTLLSPKNVLRVHLCSFVCFCCYKPRKSIVSSPLEGS